MAFMTFGSFNFNTCFCFWLILFILVCERGLSQFINWYSRVWLYSHCSIWIRMQITSVESNFVNLSYSNHVLQALFGFLNIVYFYVINILYFYSTQGYLFCLIIFSRQYIRYIILHRYRYCSNYGQYIFCYYKRITYILQIYIFYVFIGYFDFFINILIL